MFPGDLLESTYPDPNNPEEVVGRSEVERRKEYVKQLEKELYDGENHPLTRMVKRCLHNVPSRRPTTEQLVTELEEVRASIEGPCGAIERADAVRRVVMMKEVLRKEAEVREKTEQLTAKDEQIRLAQVTNSYCTFILGNKLCRGQYTVWLLLLLLLFRLTHQQEVQWGREDNTLSYLRQKC